MLCFRSTTMHFLGSHISPHSVVNRTDLLAKAVIFLNVIVTGKDLSIMLHLVCFTQIRDSVTSCAASPPYRFAITVAREFEGSWGAATMI